MNDEKELKALALKDSIAHWTRLASGNRQPGEMPSAKQCALCKLYYQLGCQGCPVMQETGEELCQDTPYDKIITILAGLPPSTTIQTLLDSTEFKEAAKEELEFLISLRENI